MLSPSESGVLCWTGKFVIADTDDGTQCLRRGFFGGGRLVKSIGIPALLAAVALAAWTAPVVCQGLPGDNVALGSGLGSLGMPPHSHSEPIPLPPVETPPVETPADFPPSDGQLTLAEAETLAVAYHPAMREAEGRLRAAQGNWQQVGLRPNPEIGYLGEEMGDSGTAGKQGAFISKEFVTAGKLRLNRAVASRETAAAEQRLELVRLQLLTTVRIQYFEVLAAQRSLTLARQLTDIAAESVRASELRLKALDIPRVALLQSQIESESTSLLEQQASERYDAAWRRLATAIGLKDTQPRVLDDALVRPLPEFTWDQARQRVLAGSPELSELRFAVDRARWAVERATAGRVPNVMLEGGAQHDNVTGDEIANVRLSMPLPLFDRNQGAITQAYGELAAAQAALEEKELALEQRLAAAMRDYATARERVTRFAEKVLPVARESLDIISKGYQEGELDYLAVLTIQQTYAEKNLSYLRDLETAWKKWAEIDGLLAGPLADNAD